MKKDFFKFIKKQWFRVWIAFMTLSLFSFSVSAEYQPQANFMKRVVVSASEPIYKFSSDVLSGGSIDVYVPQYKETLGENPVPNYYEVPVHIRNYSTKASASWYDEDIDYNLSFKFTDIKGIEIESLPEGDTRTVEIYKNDNAEPIATLSASNLSVDNIAETLASVSAHNSQDTYYLRFSPNWNLAEDENICVQMKAEPVRTGGKYNDLRNLGAVIGLKQSNGDTDSGWHAFLDEENAVDENNPVSDFDGYNLIITGSGKATITVKWNTEYFQLNKHFYDNSSGRINSFTFNATIDPETEETLSEPFNEIVKTDSGDESTITINADSGSALTSHRTRYAIQVYNTGAQSYGDFDFFAVNGDPNYDNAYIQVNITPIS